MEAGPQHTTGTSSTPEGGTSAEASTRGKDSGKSKMQRIGDHTRGLFDDFSTWMELRMRLFQVDVQDRIQKKVEEAVRKAAPVFLGLLTLLFALVTAALFAGRALGHPAWGFLIVTGFLLVVTLILWGRSRSIARARDDGDAAEAVSADGPVKPFTDATIPNGTPPGRTPSKAPGRRMSAPKKGGTT